VIRAAGVTALAATLIGCAPRATSVVEPTWSWRPVPPAAYAAYLGGRLAVLGGELEQAAALFAHARALAPDEPEPAAAYIEVLARLGPPERALREAWAAERRFPDAGIIHAASGAAAYRAGDFAAAASAYARAIARAPDRERPYLRQAQSFRRLGDSERELAAYRALVRARPSSVTGAYRLGVRLAALGRPGQAERWLQTAVGLEPDHLAARVALARLAWRDGRRRTALTHLREAFDRGGSTGSGARRILALVRGDGAAATVAAALALDRDDLAPAVRLLLGETLLTSGASGAALALSRRVLDAHPGHPDAVRLHALALLRLLAESW
jgi:tetratricopeptide (TPR) repeat protein